MTITARNPIRLRAGDPHAKDDLMWGDDEGPLACCTGLLRDVNQ